MEAFTNKYYKDEWKEKSALKNTPRYAEGTFGESKDGYAVYDGATNLMGYVTKDGNFRPNGELTEYKASFLKTAKEILVEEGKVFSL